MLHGYLRESHGDEHKDICKTFWDILENNALWFYNIIAMLLFIWLQEGLF